MGWIVMGIGAVLGLYFAFTDYAFNGGDLLALGILFTGWMIALRQDVRRGL